MELSALGFGIGGAVGMIGVYLIVKFFIPTYLDTTFEKWFRIISCILVVVVCIFLGGYIFRTEIRMGDYSHKTCSSEGCSNSPVCKFYLLETDYYCIDHMSAAYDSFEAGEGVYAPSVDRAGKGKIHAWMAAQQLAIRELGLSDEARFCSAGEYSAIYNNTYWIVRAHVTDYDTAGTPEYIYFKAQFSFTGEDEVYLWDFDYDK